jgi:hypothetical protein
MTGRHGVPARPYLYTTDVHGLRAVNGICGGGGLDADGVRIDAARDVHLTVTSGPELRFTNGSVKGKGGTVTFSTPPGGTCDVTGTTFTSVTPVFDGCSPVGP